MDVLVDTKHLTLEVDGPNADPSTVDPAKLMEFGAAFLSLLARIAEDEETPLTFAGLAIEPKCVAIKFTPGNLDEAKHASILSAAFVRGDPTPRGLSRHVNRVQESLRAFPLGYKANVIVGPWREPLITPESRTEASAPFAVENVRVKIVRVGGRRPVVRAKPLRENDAFSVEVTEEQAMALGAHLYREVDLVLSVLRGENDKRITSYLKEFQPVSEEDSGEAWRRWFQPHAEYWKGVADIEGTLRNRDRS